MCLVCKAACVHNVHGWPSLIAAALRQGRALSYTALSRAALQLMCHLHALAHMVQERLAEAQTYEASLVEWKDRLKAEAVRQLQERSRVLQEWSQRLEQQEQVAAAAQVPLAPQSHLVRAFCMRSRPGEGAAPCLKSSQASCQEHNEVADHAFHALLDQLRLFKTRVCTSSDIMFIVLSSECLLVSIAQHG